MKLFYKVKMFKYQVLYIISYILVNMLFKQLNRKSIDNNYQSLDQILELANTDSDLSIKDILGTWIIRSDIHPLYKFVIKEENILQENTKQDLNKVCEKENLHCQNEILGSVKLPNVTEFCKFKITPFYFRFIQKQGYKFILHKNGVIKFVPNGNSFLHKFALARLDSKGWIDLYKNYKHAKQNGCFCLGILTKDKKHLIRYNRWKKSKPDYFWTAEKIT